MVSDNDHSTAQLSQIIASRVSHQCMQSASVLCIYETPYGIHRVLSEYTVQMCNSRLVESSFILSSVSTNNGNDD